MANGAGRRNMFSENPFFGSGRAESASPPGSNVRQPPGQSQPKVPAVSAA